LLHFISKIAVISHQKPPEAAKLRKFADGRSPGPRPG